MTPDDVSGRGLRIFDILGHADADTKAKYGLTDDEEWRYDWDDSFLTLFRVARSLSSFFSLLFLIL